MRMICFLFFMGCGRTQKVIEPSNEQVVIDADGDGYSQEEDCNDDDSSVHPSAPELCDGIDNNCDEQVDENVTSIFYEDVDGDGFGVFDQTIEACETPIGYSNTGTDCDDGSDTIYPGAPELCDGIDNNCDERLDDNMQEWYADTDGDGYGDPNVQEMLCDDSPQGFVSNSDDCNDSEELAHAQAAEICDDIDNDCDGEIDEELRTIYYLDEDTDGFGGYLYIDACYPPQGYVEEGGDCNDIDTEIYPGAPEICDFVDNNCDGTFDENTAVDAPLWYEDVDGDGFGTEDVTTNNCFQPTGYVAEMGDCDDGNADVSPDALEEVANGIDDDCDGIEHCYLDADGDGYRSDQGTIDSSDLDCTDILEASGTVSAGDCDDTNSTSNPDASEICDGLDNDCDGEIDGSNAIDALSFYADTDGDGFGDASSALNSCTQPTGYTTSSTDCDDDNNTISPDAEEICDGTDNNCDGVIDEDGSADAFTWYFDADEDGFGDENVMETSCIQPNGYILDAGDCDDSDGGISPQASEFCGSDDLNCDGLLPNCQNCQSILESGLSYGDGLYTLETSNGFIATYCDMTTDGGGWTMVQRTVWDWSDSQSLLTGYSTWFNSNIGSPAPGSAYRMAGSVWTEMNIEGEQLLVNYARDFSSATNCDPLYYQGTAEVSVTSSGTSVSNLSQTVGIMSSSTLSATDSGSSASCVNGASAVPWFYSSCCSTCPTYKGGYWNDEPHPMAHYVDFEPDEFGNTISEVCPSGAARMNDNGSSFEGINEMEFFLR